MKLVVVNFPEEMLDRLDAYVEQCKSRNKLPTSRAAVIRMCVANELERALEPISRKGEAAE